MVPPLLEWTYFRGDKVQIMKGKDEGKIGKYLYFYFYSGDGFNDKEKQNKSKINNDNIDFRV